MSLAVSLLLAIFYGVIEAVTEWLPISSSAHLLLLDRIPNLGLSYTYGEEFLDLFTAVLELGAAIAALIYFFKDLFPREETEAAGEDAVNAQQTEKIWSLWLRIIVGCVPVGIAGLLISQLLSDEQNNKLNSFLVIGIMLLIVGVVFLVSELLLKRRKRHCLEEGTLSYRYDRVSSMPLWLCLVIGLIQVLSVIPGTSRSGVTILAALLLGVPRSISVRYSFYMSIPLLICSSVLSFISYGTSGAALDLNMGLTLGVGLVTSLLLSLLLIRFLVTFLEKHTLNVFGIYRVGLGGIVLGLSLGGVI